MDHRQAGARQDEGGGKGQEAYRGSRFSLPALYLGTIKGFYGSIIISSFCYFGYIRHMAYVLFG
jgi:hypothetical protein